MITLCLSEGEVLDVINSLDTYSRIWMGQFDHLDLAWRMWRFATYGQSRESRVCEELLMGMRALFLPEAAVLGRGASSEYGATRSTSSPSAHTTYSRSSV